MIPDIESMGFALVLDFAGPRQEPESIVERLGAILQKHGVARVECRTRDSGRALGKIKDL